jgi:hypothetical protein
MVKEIKKKHHLKTVSDNTAKDCYLRYSRYHHLNESNVGRFEEFITDPFLFTNSFSDSLEAVSL